MRLDKFVWCVRLAKTRSLAAELIIKNKIRLNNADSKPSKEVSKGDVISMHRNSAIFTFTVLNLCNNRLSAHLVKDFIEETTSDEEKEKNRVYLESQKHYRLSNGKPSKKNRRDIEGFLDQWLE